MDPIISGLYTLILAGGNGRRLWPLSREELPKQFLSLGGQLSFLQETAERVLKVTDPSNLRVVTKETWSALVRHQLRWVGKFGTNLVIAEPEGRSTAPAIALGIATLLAEGASEEDLILVCPSDQRIGNVERFCEAVCTACEGAKEGYLMTFGVPPKAPETGFGYLKTVPCPGRSFFRVERFIEKPAFEDAVQFVSSGDFLWNGGIFCFRLGTMLEALEKHFPEAGIPARSGLDALLEVFSKIDPLSIDYAVMEKSEKVAAVLLDADWSDVGTWDAVYEISRKDEKDNATYGDAFLMESVDNFIFSQDRLVAGVDLRSMIVVDTPDALFVAPRGSSQKVRELVQQLLFEGRKEALEAPVDVRPWGTYRILFQGDRYKIKHIEINPGARLSLQFHYHRTEHWVVVRGTAQVELDGKRTLVHEGESLYVPKSTPHRLSNPGKVPLEIIEIQNGEYVGEDDIVRLSDDFDRKG